MDERMKLGLVLLFGIFSLGVHPGSADQQDSHVSQPTPLAHPKTGGYADPACDEARDLERKMHAARVKSLLSLASGFGRCSNYSDTNPPGEYVKFQNEWGSITSETCLSSLAGAMQTLFPALLTKSNDVLAPLHGMSQCILRSGKSKGQYDWECVRTISAQIVAKINPLIQDPTALKVTSYGEKLKLLDLMLSKAKECRVSPGAKHPEWQGLCFDRLHESTEALVKSFLPYAGDALLEIQRTRDPKTDSDCYPHSGGEGNGHIYPENCSLEKSFEAVRKAFVR